MTTLAKDPRGDVDEAQFIDSSKLVSKDTEISAIKDMQLRTGLADSTNLRTSFDNSCYHAQLHLTIKRWQ